MYHVARIFVVNGNRVFMLQLVIHNCTYDL